MTEMTVPLVDRGNGLWGSPSPAWDHLIMRESSGRPTVIQSPSVVDVNTGGNEAEGLFQITPKTWARARGTDFAPSARLATPLQQAIVAARIFTANPSGGDWGAGRPGRDPAADLAAGLVPAEAAPAVPAPQTYGMPTGSNSGGYGGGGVRFPDWVYALGQAFGLKPSTYPGHQESDRTAEGYAPNPQHLNRGIDWAAPGTPDEVDRMQRFANYLFSIKSELEQVIWWNPNTNQKVGVAVGKDVTNTPYYDYPGGYDDHRDHVHTRQSHPIPLPGGVGTVTTPPVPVALRPAFTELDFYSGKKVGQGFDVRSRIPTNFFIHTEEGNGTAESLARYCDGSNGVSYHYALRDRRLADIVDTDYYSWSVLSANVFSINLCFAGSFSAWTRQQWLAREADIEIAAYIAVQDCRKYAIPFDVIAPPYHQAAGISDHKYVTQQLGIGDHHDVGDNFPWDVFTRYVQKYAGQPTTTPPPTQGDDFLMALTEAEQRELLDGVRVIRKEQTQRHPSRSAVRNPNEGLVDTWAGMDLNTDGNVDLLATFLRGLTKYPPAVQRLQRVAAGGEPGRSPDDALQATAMLATLKDFYQLLKAVPVGSKPVTEATPSAIGVDTTSVLRQLEAAQAAIAALTAENAALNRALDATKVTQNLGPIPDAPASVPATTSDADIPEYQDTTGDKIQRAVDASMDYTNHVLSMDAAQRTALTRALDSIAPVKEENKP